MFYEHKIDDLFKAYDADNTPGCSILVRHKGSVIYRKAFGMANIEYGLKNTPDTVFHVASVSKQFVAFCILLLEEEGKLSLDDEIQKYLSQLPEFAFKITIRSLLHHTSGLREQWDLFELSGSTMEDLATSEHIMQLASRQRELNFIPGDKFLYCNTGYTILAQIIKAVTGKSIRKFADEKIFKPLGMDSTYFRDDHSEITYNRAYSYGINKKNGKYTNIALTFDITGSTGLNTTVNDLIKWIDNFYKPVICSRRVIECMSEKYILNSGETIDYCRGIISYNYRGMTLLKHTGSNAGFQSLLITIPDEELDVIILSNYKYSFPYLKGYKIIDIVLNDILLPNKRSNYYSNEDLYKFSEEGLYANDTYNKIYLSKCNGIVLRQEDNDMLFRHMEGNEYYCQENGFLLYLLADGFYLQRDSLYRKVMQLEITDEDREGVSGEYYSNELKTIYELSFEDNQLLINNIKSGITNFIKIGENSYLAQNKEGINLKIKRDNGRTYFLFNTERTKNLKFIKLGTNEL